MQNINSPETRLKEVVLHTTDPKQMIDKYTAHNLVHSWTEDIVDPDTGEAATIERSEILLQEGKLITQDDIPQLLFYLQSGYIDYVPVTNQCRPAHLHLFKSHPYLAWFSSSLEKSRVLYIHHASDAAKAHEIAADYAEQIMSGNIYCTAIKASSLQYVQNNRQFGENEHTFFFTITVTISSEDGAPWKKQYLTQAVDTNEAAAVIEAFRKESAPDDDCCDIITEVKDINITDIIPLDFCKEYCPE